jgi:PAS domain S-box-containing protein
MGAIALMSGVRTLCPIDRDPTSEDSLHPETRSSCVVVVDNDRVVGILTERDVVRLSAQQQPLDQLLVAEAMAQPVITRRQSDLADLFSTIELLQQHHIRHLPIVDEQERLVGLVTHESLRQLTRPVDWLRLRLAQEVMSAQVLTAGPDCSVLEIARLMADRRVSSVVIVVPGGSSDAPFERAVGLMTEHDLVQFQALRLSLAETTAQAVMSSPVFTVSPETSLGTVQQIMEQHWIGRVIVAGEQGELLGIVTQTSLLQVFNPIDLYTLAEVLEKKVTRLETERISLLEIRATELERQVQERTHTLQVQAERDRLMAELTAQILASLDVQTILDTTVQQVRQILGCDRVNIWRFEADWATVVVAESTESALSLMGERIAETCFLQTQAEVYRQGRIRVVPDIYTTEMADCHRDMLIRLQTRAKILVPLLCGDELWGLLSVTEAPPRDWQPAEVEFVRSLSMQLAIALQQASTHAQLQAELQERQQAERQLRQSTERLQEAQRIAHIGNWELDLQHNTLYWSEEVFRLFEIDPQQFGASYEAFLELVHPDDRTLVDETYANHLRDRQPCRLVHRLLVPEAQIKYVQEQWETISSADGTPLISRGTVQDVTQQQLAELRRDRAEAELRQVIEGTAAVTGEAFFPALVRHISTALGVRYASIDQAMPEGFQVLAFFADGELSPPLFLPYDELPCCSKSLQTGSCCHPTGVQALYPDNALFADLQVDSYLGVRLENAAGDPIGNLCILHDAPLTDPDWAQTLLTIFAARAGAELERLMTAQALEQLNRELESRILERTAALAERETLLQDFLDNANDLIQIVDIDTGRFKFVNEAWRDILGYTAAEVEQLIVFDVLAPDCITHCQHMMEQMRAGTLTNVEQVELTFVSKLGRTVLVEGSINCRGGGSADGRQQTLSTRAILRDVTAKKAAEQELRRRETRYRALMEGASDAILLANLEGYLIEVNPQAGELMGYDHHDLVGMHFTQLHPPEILPNVVEAFGTLAQMGRLEALNLEILRQDGQRVPVDITGSLIEVDGENIIQGIFHDLRERLQTEQALRESESRFRRVFESNVVGMMFTDFSGRISDANDRFLDLLGYTRQDLESGGGPNWVNLTPPEYQAQDEAAIAHLQNHATVQPWEKAYRHKDGHLVPVLIGVAMLSHEDESCVCVVVDISDRKRYETALQESQQFQQTVLDTVPLSVFWKDRAFTYLGANQRFLQDAGLSSVSELVGKTDFDMPWDVTETEAYRADDRIVMKSGEAKLGIIEPQHQQDGTAIWLETNKLPLRNLAGEVVGVLGTYQDITERRNVEISLQRQLAAIEAAVNGIAILEDERYLYVNSSHVKMFGYEQAGELIGQSWQMLYSPEQIERFDREIFPALRAQKSWQGEVTATRKDGTTFPQQLSLTLSADNLLICVCQDISDRKQSEDSLRESEEKFRQLAEVVDAVFWILHLNRTDRVYVSPAYERIWGRPCTELYVTPDAWIEMIHADDREQVLAAIPKQIEGTFDEEYRIIRPDGTQRWIRDRAFPIRNAQGQIYRLAGIAEDITERKRNEEIIRQQAGRETVLREITQRIRESLDLQTIFDTACDEIRICLRADRVGIFKFYPDSGYDDGEFVAESVVNGFPSVVAIRVHDHCFGENYVNLYAQGRYHVIDDIYSNGLTPCHTDVLAQFQVRANLVMPLHSNHQLWGLLCIHQCDAPRHWHQSEIDLGQQLANQSAIAIQQAILYEQLQQELQEREQAQMQLTLTNQELLRATHLKDEFLANMSHELRTPLNAILGLTEALQEEDVFGAVNAQQLKAIKTVERSGSHLLELINDVLDVAKIEAGQMELNVTPTAIAPLCHSSLAFVKQPALKKRIQLTVNLPTDLPTLTLDERRIRQVLINLLSNAVKFTSEGGRITLEVIPLAPSPSSLEPPYLRFAVTDTGIGIPPTEQQRLFQPFVQVDSALNRQYEGTGLGLALVKRIVELHGGQVGLTSTIGIGSCFTVDLPYGEAIPLPPAPSPPSAAAPEAPTPTKATIPASAPLILLAEDNEANISTMVSYLEAKGYRVDIAHNGQEAIDRLQQLTPDLILMDIQMPGMDGLEAIGQLRRIPQVAKVPVIALTSLAMPGDRDRCLAAGATEYLSKPVRLKQLVDLIQTLILADHPPTIPNS